MQSLIMDRRAFLAREAELALREAEEEEEDVGVNKGYAAFLKSQKKKKGTPAMVRRFVVVCGFAKEVRTRMWCLRM